VKKWVLPSPTRIHLDSMTVFSGKYNSMRNIRLDSAYPVIEGYKDLAAIGYRLNFSDFIGISSFNFSALFSPDKNLPAKEKVHLGFDFQYWQLKISAGLNSTDFYDLFGPTKMSRKGHFAGLDYKKSLLYDKPKTMDVNLAIRYYGGLERLPDYQNVVATYDKLVSAKVNLDYQYIRKSLGSVDEEKGIRCQAISYTTSVNGRLYPRLYGHFNYGIPLALNHSSVWLRGSTGYCFGDKANPFANFFFGGFGNNWIDRLSEKRYREYYSFPGVALNHIGGKNYGKLLVEWNLPPLRFRHFGFIDMYFQWLRPALFASSVVTNIGSREGIEPLPQFGVRRTLFNVGSQVDFRIVTLSRFNSTLSIGYAAAFENAHVSREFMISFKIL
jgi:hypothetical protein